MAGRARTQQGHSPGQWLALDGLTIFTTATCTRCKSAKAWLDKLGVAYKTVVVDPDDAPLIQWLHTTTGRNEVPIFFFNARWLGGGLSDVVALAQRNQLPRQETVTQL